MVSSMLQMVYSIWYMVVDSNELEQSCSSCRMIYAGSSSSSYLALAAWEDGHVSTSWLHTVTCPGLIEV